MTKHTPGPWVADETSNNDVIYIKGVGGTIVAYLIFPDSTIAVSGDAVRTRSNANFIASAPDLLEACKVVVGEWDGTVKWDDSNTSIDRCRAAIAKAEGES